jgi:3-polyprenyl-4-hydroxybenzoate decarboxylase
MARQRKRVAVALKSLTGSPALRRNRKTPHSGYVGDLREWLAKVDDLGELQSVPGADWNKEIGAISQINYQRSENPALLFDDIKDYPRGYRVLTSSMGSTRRLALAFRFSTDLDKRQLIEAFRGKPLQWEKNAATFGPRIVDSGPVFEEVHRRLSNHGPGRKARQHRYRPWQTGTHAL